ncbi:MAG TPA: DUF502 domain-containing protein [Oscillatoriales cyanobacterium M59_W2019_021]|nr:MAG: DUF502 domain-containing protein [Cyanobacteria bacterium J055]HIK30010.1 DUF502 domain-containing protein [Oscillatoriales cyanobacterium M4454_W2019_049]HIK53038.1 DUF502 domain-containing protein [Oscillatoriales cyanobacterium M59_W2019_021]
MIERLKQDLKNDLIAGLLVVIPLATTIWLTITVSTWVVNFLTRIPKRLNPFDGFHPILVNLLNLLVGLTVPLVGILLIGLMARNIVGRWLLNFGETLLQSIPLAGSVYKTLKQLLQTLLQDSNEKFRRVVLVEYPRPGIWSLGFVTGSGTREMQSKLTSPLISVFIPTTPNPTTGWYALIPENEAIDLSMSIEDAFKILLSGGIVSPEPSPPLALNPKTTRPLEKFLSSQPQSPIPAEDS